jgi:hypothetical protein
MAAAGGAPGAGVTPDGSALGGANGLGSASGPDAGGGSVVGAPLTVGALVEAADAPAPAGFSPVSNCAAAVVLRSTMATANTKSVSRKW